jgi:Asp/Glu/hydantoin racemase
VRKIAIALPISGFSNGELDRREQVIHEMLPPGVAVDLLTSPTSPKFLDLQEHFAEAVDAAVDFFKGIDPGRYAVVISAGALDPGLARARAACPVPVVGPGEASMYLASILGRTLSVVTVDRYAVVATHEFLAQVPVKPPIATVRSMELPVSVIIDDLTRGRERLEAECAAAVTEDGARALYLGSMTLGTLGITTRLQQSLGVPVINPFGVAVAAAIQCAAAQSAS